MFDMRNRKERLFFAEEWIKGGVPVNNEDSMSRFEVTKAAAVKNAVCVMPICAVVASSSVSIVASAGDSIDALSWKAKTATSSAVIRGTTWLVGSFCPAAGSGVFVVVMRAV